MTELYCYGIVAAAILLYGWLTRRVYGKGLTPTREVDSASVAHAMRKERRP